MSTATPAKPSILSISEFTSRLRALPQSAFADVNGMERFITANRVDPASLAPYLFWDEQHYTRNLVDHSDMYDLIAICWAVGQGSSIHNHKGQNCWMSVPMGRLMCRNYRVHVEDVERQYCEISPDVEFQLDPSHPCAVQPETPVHEVFNPADFKERAVSLHIYSRPFNRCTVYSAEKRTCGEIELHFNSMYGKKCAIPNVPIAT
jgi:cysteine dioxygenase